MKQRTRAPSTVGTRNGLVVLGLLLAVGITLHLLGVFDPPALLEHTRGHARTWWFPPLLALIKAALYVFALPCSALFWVVVLLYKPLAATLLLTAGGTAGALGAYAFSKRLSDSAREAVLASRFFSTLRKRSDFFTLCAARTFPYVPHSVINYGSGLLGVPLPAFLLASMIGFAVKSYVYTSAIHAIVTTGEGSPLVRLTTLAPLIGISLLLLGGRWLRGRYRSQP